MVFRLDLADAAGAGFESLLGHALQHHIFYSVLLSELAFVLVAAIAVHHQNVRLQSLHGGDKVHDAVSGIDERILHIADGLHHKQPLLLGVDGLVVLVALNGLVRAYPHIQVAIFRRLAEELHVTTMQQVVTTGNEDFFRHHYVGFQDSSFRIQD